MMNEKEILAEIERLKDKEQIIYASTGGLNQVYALDALYDDLGALIDQLDELRNGNSDTIDRTTL